MTQAVYELSVAAPHERRAEGYRAAEWPAYREGYEWALVMALRALRLAVDRWALSEREIRRRARAERAAARASVDAPRRRRREQLRPAVDGFGERGAERRQQPDRDREFTARPGGVFPVPQDHIVTTRSAVYVPFDGCGSEPFSHAAQFVAEVNTGQSKSETPTLENDPKENTSASGEVDDTQRGPR